MSAAFASFKTLWQPAEDFQLAGGLFLKLLALIYFAAFASLSVQITGLVGTDGILPFAQLLDYLYQQNGAIAWLRKPTLFWFNSSDLALQLATLAGCVFSVLLFFGYRTRPSLLALFVLYLSLFHAGQTFLSFQWDSLLLEAGFAALFITRGVSHLALFLFHWLLFRLRFMSGVSKLAGGDPSWANLTALQYYFETQPLPHWGAWYFHQLPDGLLQAGVLLVFFSELVVPFFIFLPRRFRLFAAAVTVVMQLLIIATSNHNWINLLTIALCVFLLDDELLRKVLPASLLRWTALKPAGQTDSRIMEQSVLGLMTVLIVFSSVTAFVNRFAFVHEPQPLVTATQYIRSWGVGHIFHVFPTMQTERQELQIEGSNDGLHWKVYEFKYKPGRLDKKPEFIVPHQPRLDWMIWFVPPQHPDMMLWFDRFMHQLKQGSSAVLDLLQDNPFPDGPPRFLRVQVYRYHFTDSEQRSQTGNWWKREYLGEFPFVRPRYP